MHCIHVIFSVTNDEIRLSPRRNENLVCQIIITVKATTSYQSVMSCLLHVIMKHKTILPPFDVQLQAPIFLRAGPSGTGWSAVIGETGVDPRDEHDPGCHHLVNMKSAWDCASTSFGYVPSSL